MSSFKVHDGSFGTGQGSFGGDRFVLPKKGSWSAEQVSASKLQSAEVATEESVKRLSGALGWGAVGGLALGPVGLLAGLLLGGKKTEVTFVVTFTDQRAFIATSDPKTWTAIKGAAVRIGAQNAHIMAASAAVAAPPPVSLPAAPPSSAPATERLEWAFDIGGWEFVKLPKREFQRFDIYDAKKGMRTALVVVTPDPVTDYYIYEYYERLEALGPRTSRIVIAPALRPSAERDARSWQIIVANPSELPDVLERR